MSLGTAIEITWLGHSTFVLRDADARVLLIDPFVQSNPACPADRHELARLDYLAITHGHEDHCADAIAICREHDPQVVASVEVAAWLQSEGVPAERTVAMNKGGTLQLEGVAVTMVDARHSSSFTTPSGPAYRGEAAGYVFAFADGTRIYHAGDTCVFGDMQLIAELYRPDIAMLPIGDHFTMGPREAAKACELPAVDTVIPMHFGTWPILAGTPEALRDECRARGLATRVVAARPGEAVE